MQIKHTRTQHPVGQGGFHTASIEIDRAKFHYVYDCGSDNPPADKPKGTPQRHTELAQRYLAGLGNRHMDALFVSHFDKDHVNGLPDLLSNKANAPEWVFLPYLTPIERLAIAGRHPADDDDDDPLDPEMQGFLANPAAWLLERGCRNVVYVYGNGPDEEGGTGPLLPEPPPESPRPESPREERLFLKVVSQREPPENQQVAATDTGSQISFMSHRNVVQAVSSFSAYWLFVTHCDKDWKGLPKIEALVKAALGKQEFQAIKAGSTGLAAILADSKKITALRQAYKKAATGSVKNGKYMNWSSLSVYSSPFPNSRSRPTIVRQHSFAFIDAAQFGSHDNLGGWLGTGDAELGRSDVETRFLDHFGKAQFGTATVDLLRHVGTVMIPHHGSRHNFSENLLRRIPHPLAVVPVGWASKHGHPSFKVIEALRKDYAHVYVHDLLELGLFEVIIYDGR